MSRIINYGKINGRRLFGTLLIFSIIIINIYFISNSYAAQESTITYHTNCYVNTSSPTGDKWCCYCTTIAWYNGQQVGTTNSSEICDPSYTTAYNLINEWCHI